MKVSNGSTTDVPLEGTQELLAALVANLPGAAVFVLDQDLRYVLAQGLALRETGMTAQDLLGRTTTQALGPELAQRLEPGLRAVLSGQSFSAEHEANGRSYITYGQPLLDGKGGVRALIVSHDITDRRSLEKALAEEARRSDFLLRLGDALAPLSDPRHIQEAACRVLAHELGRCRVQYAEILDERAAVVRAGYADGVSAGADEWALTELGAVVEVMRRGESVTIEDVSTDPRTVQAHDAGHFERPDVAAGIAVSLVKDARWVAALGVQSPTPRSWSPVETALVRETANRTWEAVQRALAESALRDSESRWAFLVALNDRLRAVADPESVQFEAARSLGEHLGASRVGYAEDLGDGEWVRVARNYVDAAAGVRSIEGTYRYETYGPELLRAFRAGRTVVRPDIAADPSLTPAEKQAHAELHLGSTVNLPLLKNGRLEAILFVHQDRARAWSDAEIAIMHDVAERTWDAVARVRVEEALREREEKFRSLFHAIDEGLCICEMILDPSGTPVDYRFLEVNPRFEELTGLAGATGHTAKELVPGLESRWVHTYARVGLGRECLRFEDESRAMGRWFDVFATPVEPHGRFAVIFRDITQRRRAEDALKESEERFRLTVEGAPQSVWVSDPRGRLEFVNKYWTAYSGLDLAASADDNRLAQAIHPDERTEVFRRWHSSVRSGEPFEMEARLADRHGAFRWFIVRTMPLRGADGRIVKWFGVASDVHALHLAEEAAAAARADAERAHQRIHRLQELTARLARALTPEDVIRLSAQHLASVLRARESWDCLGVAAHDSPSPVTEAGRGQSPVWLASRTQIEERYPEFARAHPRLASGVFVPLATRGRTAAVLGVGFGDERTLGAADRDFILTVARLTGDALERAHAYASEHQVAALLQESLLSDSPPEVEGAQVAVRYRPASQQFTVGGDWYELINLTGRRLGLSVGDVVGSGIAAATAMGQLRSATAAIALEGLGPGALLDRLDRFVERTPGAVLATTVFAWLDVTSGDLIYSCAGHPPPLVLDGAGQAGFLWGGRSTPLAAAGHSGLRPQARARLEPGSRILLYSDGLVERRGEAIDVGLERLARAAQSLREVPLEEFSDALVALMFSGAAQGDDVALLCVEIAPRKQVTDLAPEQASDQAVARRVQPLLVRIPGRPAELAGLRRRVRDWLDGVGLADPWRENVLLACGEACANAIEHAYSDGPPGDVDVVLDRPDEATVYLTVRDHGRWRYPPAAGNRGRGIDIIRRLMDDVEYNTGRDGTEVRMRMDIPVPGAKAPSATTVGG